ncbi:MAG: heme exporter protein D [Candidatus Nitrotoga sp. LAW]|nr:MAG: heme exporter protein D [Candidatus Nitrotoga sp. LAW]
MNWGEFFAMNGYAWYIWGSYGMALLIFIIEIVMVRHRKMLTLQQLHLMRNAEDDMT